MCQGDGAQVYCYLEEQEPLHIALYNCGPPHLSWMTLEIKISETNCTRKLKLCVGSNMPYLFFDNFFGPVHYVLPGQKK